MSGGMDKTRVHAVQKRELALEKRGCFFNNNAAFVYRDNTAQRRQAEMV